jgi:hypothetical protein
VDALLELVARLGMSGVIVMRRVVEMLRVATVVRGEGCLAGLLNCGLFTQAGMAHLKYTTAF